MIDILHTAPWISAASLDDDRLVELASYCMEHEVIEYGAWGRQMQLAMLTEIRYRGLRISHKSLEALQEACVADRGRQIDFPVDRVVDQQRRQTIEMWCRSIDRGRFPVWTRRGPPDWLEATLWS